MHLRDLGFEKAGGQALTEPLFKAVDAMFGETAAMIADGLFPGGQPLLGDGGQRLGARMIGFPRHGILSGRHRHRRLAFHIKTAQARGFMPECIVFDSWYGRLENFKLINKLGWVWLTRLKANRWVNPDRNGWCPVARVVTDAQGTIVHLKGSGLIRLFTIAAPDGGREWWATHDLNLTGLMRVRMAGYAWTIEHYHWGIKQFCGVERAQVRAARAQRNHIGLCLRAFLRLERYCYHAGISWFEVKIAIIRPAVRAYLANPLYTLPATA
ncbi:MAG TPA: hypothetical protein P5329_06900 [Candidatus Competibacteraceae bacterium]|nr:hypothetical protein [Candidatus Competibacteraceae bacterium]